MRVRSMLAVTLLLISLLQLATAQSAYSILDFGAIPNDESPATAQRNGKALYDALQAANNDLLGIRTVLVPATFPNNTASPLVFTMLPFAKFVNLTNVTLMLNGVLNAFPGDMGLWPNATNGVALNFIEFDRCNGVTITSHIPNRNASLFASPGSLVGNGYRWWWYVFLTGIDNRPHLLVLQSCQNIILQNISLFDSPQYHVLIWDGLEVLVEYVHVYVSVEEQQKIAGSFGLLGPALKIKHTATSVGARRARNGLPIFPLNTDGIDVSARNVIVRYCHVDCFDDSVCIKPANGGDILTDCAENMHVHDITIVNGVGASVGSVPPHPKVNCIRNITFERIHFDHPIKALYVKPNPCPNGPAIDGTGIIDQILYKDIVADTPLWWALWVSTQQQKQPGNGTDTGCDFLYPLPGTSCPTQGCVPVTRLTIINFSAWGGLLSPGVLRCNETGPCKDWYFENVRIDSDTGFPFGENYLCHAIDNFTIVGGNPMQCVYNASTVTPSMWEEGEELARRKMLGMPGSPLQKKL